MRRRHHRCDAFIGKRAAQAVIAGEDEFIDSPVFRVCQHRVQRRQVDVDIRYHREFPVLRSHAVVTSPGV